jgi:PPK2 family polyphosphate:nucleotide phosphotransferase
MELVYKVKPGEKINLRDFDTGQTHRVDRAAADARLASLNEQLTTIQEAHYAAGQNGILIVLQGLDTAGKDGTIRHVMTNFNPASCRVYSFKVPTSDESAHDFLWRIHKATPPMGSIAVFNRSHYEDVLVTRVHKLVSEQIIEARYQHINDFEKLLVETGTIVLKFFLFISKNEQRNRLLAREADRDKAWKLSASDWPEHELYDHYLTAYEQTLSQCSTKYAPWYVVPSDKKWYRNLAVAQTIADVIQPYKDDWERDLKERGKIQLALREAQKKAAAK